MAKKRTFSYGTNAGNPERAKWAHLGRPGSQSERRIRFIFPTRRLNYTYSKWSFCNSHGRSSNQFSPKTSDLYLLYKFDLFSIVSWRGVWGVGGLGGWEFEVGRVAPESQKQMQIGQVLSLIFIPYTYLGSKKKPLAIIFAFKKSVIFLKSGRKSCSEKLLQ